MIFKVILLAGILNCINSNPISIHHDDYSSYLQPNKYLFILDDSSHHFVTSSDSGKSESESSSLSKTKSYSPKDFVSASASSSSSSKSTSSEMSESKEKSKDTEDYHYPSDPNPHYHYSYAVHNEKTGDIKYAEEKLENGIVSGAYSLKEPDGTTRKVTYTADKKHGFKATVEKIGIPKYDSGIKSIHHEIKEKMGDDHKAESKKHEEMLSKIFSQSYIKAAPYTYYYHH